MEKKSGFLSHIQLNKAKTKWCTNCKNDPYATFKHEVQAQTARLHVHCVSKAFSVEQYILHF